jgi:hypothetical protein
MTKIVGYEGRRAKVAVNWGSAALVRDGQLLNPTTRHATPVAYLVDLVADGHVTELGRPIEIDDEVLKDSAPIVAELDRKDPAFDFLRADTGRIGGLIAHHRTTTHQTYVFDGMHAFDAYCRDVSVKVVHEHLYPTLAKDVHAALLRAALILSAQDPALNALRVANAAPRHRKQTDRLARATLRSTEDTTRFEELLEALTLKSPSYMIKYEHGVADGGGLDVDQAVRILDSAHTTHQPFTKDLMRQHPYLKAPPPPRLHYMEAASADLHFTAEIEGRPLGERVARMLELRMLERSLRGDSAVPDSPKMNKALSILRSPSPQTTASHTPIGGRLQKLVERETPESAGTRRSDALVLLGYQSGLIKNADEVEVTFFPPDRSRNYQLMLSTRNNGEGEEPLGVRPLQEGRELLLQPAVFTLLIEVDERGRQSVWLRRLQLLGPSEKIAINACPSFVLGGAYIGSLKIHVERLNADEIKTDLGTVRGVGTPTIAAARDWMAQYQALCRILELQLSERKRTFKYWRPTVMPSPSSLQRLLLVLQELGGQGHQMQVVSRINERFGARVRTNNTRREVLQHPDLVRFGQEDDQTIVLQAEGERLVAAYLQARGDIDS